MSAAAKTNVIRIREGISSPQYLQNVTFLSLLRINGIAREEITRIRYNDILVYIKYLFGNTRRPKH